MWALVNECLQSAPSPSDYAIIELNIFDYAMAVLKAKWRSWFSLNSILFLIRVIIKSFQI